MKPGSLVMCAYYPNMLGVIIRKSSYKDIGVFDSKSKSKMFTSIWSDKPHQWWEVWVDNKITIEVEGRLKLIK